MAHASQRQFTEVIDRSTSVLVAFRKEWDIDALATSLALARTLRKKGKAVDVACDGFVAPATVSFLPDVGTVQKELRGLQKFVVRVDTSRIGIEALSYDKKDTHLDIVLTPKGGQFEARDIATEAKEFKYDLVVTVGAPDYASLGKIHSAHPDFFFDRPLIAIDADASHEQYGNINIVDIAATSCGEVVARLMAGEGKHALDADTATCLLTGIIAKTRSFKDASVTPKTLETASELIAAGARRADIVQHLYRTRPLATLKLWGRALARLKYDPGIKMTWTMLVRQDFVHAGASEEYLEEVIEELISTTPDAEIISVLYERESPTQPGRIQDICGLVSSERHANALGLVSDLKPEGSRRLARLCFPDTTLVQAEKAVITSIYRSLGKTPPTGALADAMPAGMPGLEAAATRREMAG